MTCGGCAAKVQQALQAVPGVEKAEVDHKKGLTTVWSKGKPSIEPLQKAVAAAGKYQLENYATAAPVAEEVPEASLSTYRPLILIVSYIAGVCLFVQHPFGEFSWMLWMRHFMAGFFIIFSFFKLLNLNGFAATYRMYDIIAARWPIWGLMYPFVELILGIAYLINFHPQLTNWATIVILGMSSIGVIESNLNKRKIKCACLGDVFNLPMSTVTIVEDVGMVVMAAWMLTI